MIKSDEILSIQYLRGLAALGVVFCHFGFALTAYQTLSSLFIGGKVGVPVFFLISGFINVYALEKSNYKPRQLFTFLIKRSIRIDPPYWAMIALYIALGYFLNNLPLYKGVIFQFSPGQLLAHLFYAVPFTHYEYYDHIFWTLCVEFQFYILIGLLYFISSSKPYKTIFLIAFALTSLIPFSNDGLIFTYSPIFAAGIALLAFCDKKTMLNAILPVLFLSIVAYKFGITTSVILLASCVAILFANHPFKPLYFLGNISYSLYLTHSFVFEVLNGIIKRFFTGLAQYQLICFGIELLVAILFAYVFYLLIEKPSIRLSKKFIYQRTARYPVKESLI